MKYIKKIRVPFKIIRTPFRLFSLLALLIIISCSQNLSSPSPQYYYVYYLDGFPFGYVAVSDLGKRADATDLLRLTHYRGLFRLFGEDKGDYQFNVVSAFSEDGRIAYISYDDGQVTADIRVGENSAYYTSFGDDRIISADSISKPAFFRICNIFIPIPINVHLGIYPKPLTAIDLDIGSTEIIGCRSSGNDNVYMEYRGYAAEFSATEDVFKDFVGSDGILIKTSVKKPNHPLIAYRQVIPAVALPLVAKEGSEVVVPLSLRLSSPVNPALFGDSFYGGCLGGRAVGEFTFKAIFRQGPLTLREETDVSITPFNNPDETAGGFYCCGLVFEGGNLIRPVYWREPPGKPKLAAGRILLARSEKPVRILSFDVTGFPTLVSGTGFDFGAPGYSVSPKKPLEYKISYDGDEAGGFEVAGYRKQNETALIFRAEGELFGSHFSSSSNALIYSEDGLILRSMLLSVRRPEEFMVVGAALHGNGVFPGSFYLPLYGRYGFTEFRLSSLTNYPVGLTTKVCYVYDYGYGKVVFDPFGIPVRIEQGKFIAFLTSVPELTSAYKPRPSATFNGATTENPGIKDAVLEGDKL
jgi:hypothetical protein